MNLNQAPNSNRSASPNQEPEIHDVDHNEPPFHFTRFPTTTAQDSPTGMASKSSNQVRAVKVTLCNTSRSAFMKHMRHTAQDFSPPPRIRSTEVRDVNLACRGDCLYGVYHYAIVWKRHNKKRRRINNDSCLTLHCPMPDDWQPLSRLPTKLCI